MPKEVDVVAPPLIEPEPIPQQPLPIPEGSNLPAIQHAEIALTWKHYVGILFFVVFCIFSVLIWNRQTISGRWPAFESFYSAIGLQIIHTGEGIRIEGVRSELPYEGGARSLVVQGKIHNVTEKHQLVPNIKATALGPDGSEIQSWQIDAPAVKLAPDETVPFMTTIRAPEKAVVDVNLEFIEWKNGNE